MDKTKRYLRNIARLIKYTWIEDKLLLIAYFSTSFLSAVLLFVVYYFYKALIDQVTHFSPLSPGSAVFIVLVSYLFFEYLSRFVNFSFNQYYFDYFIRMKLQNILTRRFMEKLARLDFTHLENGDLRNLIAKVENTYTFRLPEVLNKLNGIIYNVAALVFSLFLALQFNPIYFLVLTLVCVPVYYMRSKYGNVAFATYTSNAPSTNYLWYLKTIFTNFQTLSEMKIYNLRGHFVHQAKLIQDKILRDYQQPMMKYTVLSTVSFIIIPVAIYFALNNFIHNLDINRYTIGDFTFFLNILFTFSSQISSLLLNVGSIYENTLYVNDYFRLLDIKNVITPPVHPIAFSNLIPREITFDHVSFTYPGARQPSLEDINFTIKKGQNVAIVGQNGAGKSTLIKLLFRFYDPTDGNILIDGVNLKDLDINNWYRHLGVLFQDYARYYLSLENNIHFGNLANTSREAVRQALVKAQGEDVLEFLPGGLTQILGRWFEGGVELSGGQWQKVAIARAIFRDAPILIMDEPTASIDAEAEAKIFNTLMREYTDKNLIFISHRFSTVRTADYIFVLEQGHLVEQGTHAELLSYGGLYHRFFNLQKRGYE